MLLSFEKGIEKNINIYVCVYIGELRTGNISDMSAIPRVHSKPH